MPGQLLDDRYEVEQQLGKQSGRWTLLARDLVTQDPVILKVLCVDEELLADDLKLFKREVEILQSLDHPAIPKYLGYFEIDLPKAGKALTLIQSYIEGYSLQTYLQQGRRFSEAEVRQLAQAVLQILIYLHQHEPSVIHRDIKPSNILLSGPAEQPVAGQVYLIDFGSVRLSTASEFTTFSVVGSDGYIAPEQVGRRAVKASDLYSLGVTLVTALTGTHATDLPRKEMRLALDQALTCNLELQQWLQQMTEPELQQRFQSAEAALVELNP